MIAIRKKEEVLEKAARDFNVKFLEFLLRGKTVKAAFDMALVQINTKDFHICCCYHSHKSDCPFEKYKKQLKEELKVS